MGKKTIAIIGTLNTKECEGYYLKDRIEEFGHNTIIIDVSLKRYTPTLKMPDISNKSIAEEAGEPLDEIGKMTRAEAMEKIIEGGIKVIKKLHNEKKIDGVIGYGGGVGTSISSAIFKTLPLGFPKLIITTFAHQAGQFIGTKDIAIMSSITDITGGDSPNRIEALTLAQAAGAISGMVQSKPQISEEKPLILATQYGVTTPHIIEAKNNLAKRGYELISFHAVGTGGQTLEDLVRSGVAAAVLDLTTHELADELCGGVFSAGPNRMEAAGKKGIPQVIAPGALEMVNFSHPKDIPIKYENRFFYYHIPGKVTLMRIDEKESKELGKIFADKINRAKGPTVMMIPLHGWSQYDKEDGPYCVDYYGKKTQIKWHNPHSDMAFVESLEKNIDDTQTNTEILKYNLHINDNKFAQITSTIIDDMIKGSWKKGKTYP